MMNAPGSLDNRQRLGLPHSRCASRAIAACLRRHCRLRIAAWFLCSPARASRGSKCVPGGLRNLMKNQAIGCHPNAALHPRVESRKTCAMPGLASADRYCAQMPGARLAAGPSGQRRHRSFLASLGLVAALGSDDISSVCWTAALARVRPWPGSAPRRIWFVRRRRVPHNCSCRLVWPSVGRNRGDGARAQERRFGRWSQPQCRLHGAGSAAACRSHRGWRAGGSGAKNISDPGGCDTRSTQILSGPGYWKRSHRGAEGAGVARPTAGSRALSRLEY